MEKHRTLLRLVADYGIETTNGWAPLRVACPKRLLPLLWALLFVLPAAVQAQFDCQPSVTIPDSVTSIGKMAYYSCTNLTSVTIPNSVTSIGDRAFDGCTSLSGITIPRSVTSIGDKAFFRCDSLSTITVDALNSFYSSVDGVLFNKSQSTLLEFPGGKAANYIVPRSVTNIGNLAFAYCARLTNVTIPNSVTAIGEWAFGACTSLRGVYFEGNAPDLGSSWRVFSDTATIYYLLETTGWSKTFDSRPTALWPPQVQASDPTFGMRTNRFGFTVSWASDKVVVVEAATDLRKPIWSPVSTNTLTGGRSYFSDADLARYPSRFYRVRSR